MLAQPWPPAFRSAASGSALAAGKEGLLQRVEAGHKLGLSGLYPGERGRVWPGMGSWRGLGTGVGLEAAGAGP